MAPSVQLNYCVCVFGITGVFRRTLLQQECAATVYQAGLECRLHSSWVREDAGWWQARCGWECHHTGVNGCGRWFCAVGGPNAAALTRPDQATGSAPPASTALWCVGLSMVPSVGLLVVGRGALLALPHYCHCGLHAIVGCCVLVAARGVLSSDPCVCMLFVC